MMMNAFFLPLKYSNPSLIHVVFNWTITIIINYVCSLQHNKIGNNNNKHDLNRHKNKPLNYVAYLLSCRSTNVQEICPNQQELRAGFRNASETLVKRARGMTPEEAGPKPRRSRNTFSTAIG